MLGSSAFASVAVAVVVVDAVADGVAADGVADVAAGGKLTPPAVEFVDAAGPACTTCGTGLNPPAETADTGDTFDGPLRFGPVAAEIGVAATASSGPGGTFVVG